MVTALALAFALQNSALQQLVPNPTGKNGYEELLLAGEFLKTQRFGDYLLIDLDGVPNLEKQNKAKPSVATLAMWDQLRGKTLLQRRKWAAERFGPAVDLLIKASGKPIFDPRPKSEAAPTFPEWPLFRDLARLVPIVAYAQFADGKNEHAVNLYACSLDAFGRTAQGTLAQSMFGLALNEIVLASIEENLVRLSQPDAKRLEETAATIIARPAAISEAVAKDAKFTLTQFDEIARQPSLAAELFGSDDEEGFGAIQKLSESDRAMLFRMIRERFAVEMEDRVQKFKGPERGWVDSDRFERNTELKWGTLDEIANAVLHMLVPMYSQIGVMAARSRTQLRLLGLLSSVIRYRWEHNQMPNRLEDAVGKDRVMDPLSQLPFELRRDGSSSFSIVSKGVKQTGEIALRYRRQPNSGSPGPP